MIADIDWTGLALFVAAVGVAIPSIIAAVGNYRRNKETHSMVTQIDRAVNGQPPGTQTLVANVQDMHDALPPIEEDALLPLMRRVATHLEEHPHNE